MGTDKWNEEEYKKIYNMITTRFPKAKVSPYESGNFMNKQTRPTIKVSGLSSSNLTEFRDDDIYAYAHPAHSSGIEFLSNWRGKEPGVSRVLPLKFQSFDGKEYIFPIKKITGVDVEYDEYQILNPQDQRKILPIKNNMYNIVAPYKTIASLVFDLKISNNIDQKLMELAK